MEADGSRFHKTLSEPFYNIIANGNFTPKPLQCIDRTSPLSEALSKLTRPDDATWWTAPSSVVVVDGSMGHSLCLDGVVICRALWHLQNVNAGKSLTPLLKTFETSPVSKIIEWGQGCLYTEVSCNSTFKTVLSHFKDDSKLIMINDIPEHTHSKFMFSLGDLMGILEKMEIFNTQALTPRRRRTINAISGIKTPYYDKITSVWDDETVISVLKIVAESGVTAVMVNSRVTSFGKAVNCVLSVTDIIKYLREWQDCHKRDFSIYSRVMNFINGCRQMFDLKTLYPCITVGYGEDIWTILHKMRTCCVHRLFITDDRNNIVGVLSASDLGKIIALEIAQK